LCGNAHTGGLGENPDPNRRPGTVAGKSARSVVGWLAGKAGGRWRERNIDSTQRKDWASARWGDSPNRCSKPGRVAQAQKDVKYEGTSRDVYENK
jgi:hypothetical protein